MFFSFFQNFDFSGCKEQKMVQNDKKFCLWRLVSQEPHMIVIYVTPVWNENIFRWFFIFSKFWFFGLLGGVKGRKTIENDKIFLLHSISQEPCIIWLSFMVHICKMIISSGVFFIFQNFDFLGPQALAWRAGDRPHPCYHPRKPRKRKLGRAMKILPKGKAVWADIAHAKL